MSAMGRRAPRARFLTVVTAGLLLAPGAAWAQDPGTSIQAGLVVDRYAFGDEQATGIRSLSLFSLPFAAGTPVTDRIAFSVRGAFAQGSLDPADGSSVQVSGLTDTEVRLGFRLPGDWVYQVEAIAVLPTGNVSHTADEALLAGAIAADLLPFRISNWGSGGGVGLHTSAARSFGETGAGFSASYVVGREFEPVAGESFGYRPGNQLRVRAALDHNLGPAAKLAFVLTVERFSEDALEGTNLFRAGNRVQAVGSYAFRTTPASSALVYGGLLHRGQGTALLEVAPAVPSQQLLLAGGGIRLPMGWGVLVPSADTRLFRSQDGAGQGWLMGVGATAELRSGTAVLAPGLRARFGSVLVREGVESGITGLELSFTSRFRR